MLRFALPLLLLMGTAASSAAVPGDQKERDARELDKVLAGMKPGTPVECIRDYDTQGGIEIIGNTVLYHVSSKRLWRNDIENCSILEPDSLLVVERFGPQQCKMDFFRVVDRATRSVHGMCHFGNFTPYTK